VELTTFAWLGLGFTLGVIHAFDADHVMALSVFATRERSGGRAIAAGLRWAAGHGFMLLVAGGALLLLGRALPPEAALWAERAVGLTMIGLGVYVWMELLRSEAHLHFHAHDDLPPHAHWHLHTRGDRHRRDAALNSQSTSQRTPEHGSEPISEHAHSHGPVMVGALHGLAGSTPLLAVVGASSVSPLLGLAYLLLFAVGVALAMAVVSGLLGRLASRLASEAGGARPSRGLSVLRGLSASGSIALGGWLLALS